MISLTLSLSGKRVAVASFHAIGHFPRKGLTIGLGKNFLWIRNNFLNAAKVAASGKATRT